jgi:AraC-like DNA-binding protein
LIYAASGVLSVWTEQGSWVAPPQCAVWAAPGVSHAIRFTGVASLRTLYLRPTIGVQPECSAVVAVSPLLRELIVRAIAIGMLDARLPTHVAMTDLLLAELQARPKLSLDLPKPTSARFRQIADHVLASRDGQQSRAGLARTFAMSVRTLERGFVNETGLSFGRWLRQARFLEAVRRLGEGAPVKRVAADAGYRSPSAFIAAFRAALDTTPGRYFSGRCRPCPPSPSREG